MVTTFTGLGSGGVPQDRRRYAGRIFIDHNRLDTYEEDGTYALPHKSIVSALSKSPLPSPADVQTVMNSSNPSGIDRVCVFQLEPGYYNEDVEVGTIMTLRGLSRMLTRIKKVEGKSGFPILLLDGLTIDTLDLSVMGGVIINNCDIDVLNISVAPAVFQVTDSVIKEATFIPGSGAVFHDTIIDGLTVNLTEGASGQIVARNCTLDNPTVTQENDEELTWKLEKCVVDNGWVAQDFEYIENTNSVLRDLNHSGAASYSLVSVGPAEA